MPCPTVHDINVKSVCPHVDRGIVDNTLLATPELALIPSQVIPGLNSTSLLRKRRKARKIWVKLCDGVCPSKGSFERKNVEAMPFKDIVCMCTHDMKAEKKSEFTSSTVWADQKEETVLNLMEQIVATMYGGLDYSDGAFAGLPDFCEIEIDALQCDFNFFKDFTIQTTPGDPTTGDVDPTARFTTVYLIRAARNANDSRGIKWMWGNGQGMDFDKEFITSVLDTDKTAAVGENCFRQELHQYIEGFVSLRCSSEWDCAAIRNVPMFCLDGFYLELVIKRTFALFPAANKPNLILIDDEAIAIWEANRVHASAVNEGLRAFDGPLGSSVLVLETLGRRVPIARVEMIPETVYIADISDPPLPQYKQRALEVRAAQNN